MTMRELAKLANVSISTVSKAFNDADDINLQTKERIFKIAREQGCYGEFYKGKYHKKIIAIICHEFSSSYYTVFIECLKEIIEKSGGICIVSVDNFDCSTQSELIEYYASYLKVDGIIVFSLKSKLKKGYNVPIVSLFGSADESVDFVKVDFRATIFEAVKVLIELGHKKIAFFGEGHTTERAVVFEEVTSALSKEKSVIFESKYRFEEAGKDCAMQLLQNPAGCSAIICAYDNIAFGAIKELKKQGFKVPEDFSVIGTDNISFAEYTETPLSSIDSAPHEVCMIVWELLNKKIKNPFFKSMQQITVKSKLVLRESVARKI